MSEIRRNSGSSGPKNDDNLSLKSGVSVSRAAELQALEVLKEMSNPCTWKGEAAQVVKRSDLDKLVQRISAILDDGNTHSVSPIAMGTLSAELASLKLQVSEFKNRAEKAEEAARLYETDFLRATKLLDEEKVKSKREIESLSSIKAEQLSRLNEAKEELRALKLAQSKSKGTASPDTEKAAAKALKEKGDLVTSLNNQLQQSNKEIEESRSRVKRFETQVLKLQNELNIAQAQANVKPEATFAAVASAAGNATVNLSSKVWGMLSSKGKEFMLKAKNVEEGDVKGRAFWVKAAFDHTSAAAALHFKEPFLEVFEDLKVISYSSRNAFSPFVNRYISAIIGDGPPLTKEEIDRMLDEVDTTQVRMSRPYSEKGIKTLDDFIKRGGQIDGLGESDIHEDDVTESRKVFRAPAKPEPKKRKQNWYSRLKGSISSFASGVKENFITRRKRNHSLVLRLKKRWGTFWGGLLAWPLSFLSLFRKSPRSEV